MSSENATSPDARGNGANWGIYTLAAIVVAVVGTPLAFLAYLAFFTPFYLMIYGTDWWQKFLEINAVAGHWQFWVYIMPITGALAMLGFAVHQIHLEEDHKNARRRNCGNCCR